MFAPITNHRCKSIITMILASAAWSAASAANYRADKMDTALQGAAAADRAAQRVIVQFNDPITSSDSAELRHGGVRLGNSLNRSTYVANVQAGALAPLSN